jgi:predicted GH43/DUF377 family glycosyl hydrolase
LENNKSRGEFVAKKYLNVLCFFIQFILFSFLLCNKQAFVANKPSVVLYTQILRFDEINEESDLIYNASIIEHGDGYILVFRQETQHVLCDICGYRQSQIKVVCLNKNFTQTTVVKTIDLPRSPEDARIFSWQGQLFLTYNDDSMVHEHEGKKKKTLWHRRIFMGKLDQENACLSEISQVPSGDINLISVEKNWIPFEFSEGKGVLHYIYSVIPYTIIKIEDGKCDVTKRNMFSDQCPWDTKVWGDIRGGTPARLVDGVYLTFFHSQKYNEKKKEWRYVMGAYIFEAFPPFKILAITPEPIQHKDFYTARHKVKSLHVIYPAGFAMENTDKGRILLHVACGENDSSIRIVTIDKDLLFASMVPIV